MAKIVKNSNGGYSLIDNGVTVSENLKVVFDKRKGCGDIKIPEGYGRKWLSESKFGEGISEIDLENIPSRGISSGISQRVSMPKLNWLDFVDDDDKLILDEIRQRAEIKMNRKHIENQIEATKKALEELYGKLDIKM
jgi:hypothetical protein